MYKKKDIKDLPMEVKEELVDLIYHRSISVDDLISLEEKVSSKYNYKTIYDELLNFNLPHFWVVSTNSTKEADDCFYIVFTRLLTPKEEQSLLNAMVNLSLFDEITTHSLSSKYSIY